MAGSTRTRRRSATTATPIRRCDIHGTGSGLHMTNNVVIEDNWVHDLHEGEDSHNDAVLTNGGAHMVVRHNTLENPHTQTAVVALYGDVEAVVDVVVADNLLDGGGYTVYGGSVAGKPYSDGRRRHPLHRQPVRPALPPRRWAVRARLRLRPRPAGQRVGGQRVARQRGSC